MSGAEKKLTRGYPESIRLAPPNDKSRKNEQSPNRPPNVRGYLGMVNP